MLSRRNTASRELLLLLIAMILLAVLAQAAKPALTIDEAVLAPTVAITAPAYALDSSTNPYWAPPHAFTRKPAPVYSDDQERDAESQ